ncbi:hypothetical protein DMNBHIDG_03042 [Candidatus Methanoperedenaceae archaeon GB37]|nr:hypothetical protein DMNBHIDG_03042 [Candidatus Methanoperedenaceae archaeon GB37]
MKDQTHKKRILTAIVALPVVIWIVLKAPFFIFCLFAFLIGILGCLEFGRLWDLHNLTSLNIFQAFLNLLILIGFAAHYPLLGITLAFFFLALYFIWAYGHQPKLTSFLPAMSLGSILSQCFSRTCPFFYYPTPRPYFITLDTFYDFCCRYRGILYRP